MIDGILWIVGFSLVLVLPGYFLTFILFKRLEPLDRLLASVGLSIAITAILAFILGGPFAKVFGGWSVENVWIALFATACVIGVVSLMYANARIPRIPRRRSGNNAGR